MKTNTTILRPGKLCLCWLAALLAVAMTATAQPLSVVLHMQPNPSPYLSDWEQRSETIVLTISNSSAQVQNVYFTGTVTGDNGVSGQTKQGFKPARALQVPPNTTTSYTGPQLKGMFVWEEIQSTGVNVASITRSGMLPEGNYELCVTVKSFQTDEVLTSVEPSGCTPSFTIALPQPPVVTTPPCEEAISSAQGQPILFSWMPMAGTPQRVQYRLRIVEIIGNRSANDALQSATTPPVFDKTISGNSYMLNPVQLVTPNRPGPIKFAWSVTAIDPSNKTSFSNNGESEACSFEYAKGVSPTSNTDGSARVQAWIEIGSVSKNCALFGICKIHIEDIGSDKKKPGTKDIPDSRLDQKKPKVYATLQLSRDGKALTVNLSESDLTQYQPDKLQYFKGKTSVTFEEDNPVAPKIWRDSLHAVYPVVIKAGVYPLKHSGTLYIIESIRIEPLGTPPFYADVPPKDSVVADTVPCKDIEEKIKAAEAELAGLTTELAGIDAKISSAKDALKDCNDELKKLEAACDRAKNGGSGGKGNEKDGFSYWDKIMSQYEKSGMEPSAKAKEEWADKKKKMDEACKKKDAQKEKCDKLAADLKALQDRKAALPGLIRTGEGGLGGLKEALEKCKKEAEDKKRKAAAGGTTAGAGAGAGAAGSGSTAGGEDPGHPGTGADKAGKPCDPEGAEMTTGPFKVFDPCRVEGDIELTPCGVTRFNNEILEYMKKIYDKIKPLATAKEMAESIAKAGSLHKAVCVNIHIVRDWKMVTYYWKCIKGKWVLMGTKEGLRGTMDYGWFDLRDKNTGVCCWIFAKDEMADSVDLKEKIQEKLDECR